MTPIINQRRAAARVESLRRLALELQQRELARDDIMELLGVSVSAALSYARALGDLVESSRGGLIEQKRFRLRAGADLPSFLAALSAGDAPPAPVSKPRKPRAADAPTPGAAVRHVHVMPDDAPFRVRVLRKRPQHEPLHAAFWAGRMAA